MDMDCTFLSRFLVMGISALLCLAVLGIGLDVKIPLITKCGSRTLVGVLLAQNYSLYAHILWLSGISCKGFS